MILIEWISRGRKEPLNGCADAFHQQAARDTLPSFPPLPGEQIAHRGTSRLTLA
jgi:hypothetical protein